MQNDPPVGYNNLFALWLLGNTSDCAVVKSLYFECVHVSVCGIIYL